MDFVIDKGHFLPVFGSDCSLCRHRIGDTRTCDAFPQGIPEVIWRAEFDHHEPYPDANNPKDHGIRYEPVSE